MSRVAWRSVRAHAKQFFLTTFAVVLGVAFLSGTLALRASMSETFSKLLSSTITSDLYVQGPKIATDGGSSGSSDSTQTQPIDSSLAEQIKQMAPTDGDDAWSEAVAAMYEANDHTFAMPANPAGDEFEQAWQDEVNKVLTGDKEPDEALADAQEAAQAALDEAWATWDEK